MRALPVYLVGAFCLSIGLPAGLLAVSPDRTIPERPPVGIAPIQHPLEQLRSSTASLDTLWFGGADPVTGNAIPGGVWDFEDGTGQGWSSSDLTAIPLYTRHVTGDSAFAHGDPRNPTITAGGSTGSMWIGAHQDEAEALCWPGGQGYGNGWSQGLSRSFTYGGSGDVTLSFDYFVDSEQDFDFTYVYVVNALGTVVGPLNTSAFPDVHGFGYSGDWDPAANPNPGIGTPSSPAHDSIVIGETLINGGVGDTFEVRFIFASDSFYSDAETSFSQFLDSWYGPFGVDNISVVGELLSDLSDFEPTGTPGQETDGWIGFTDPGIGSFFAVRHLDDLEPIDESTVCTCPITVDPLNDYVAVMADVDEPGLPHPEGQHEQMVSNPIYVGGVGNRSDWVVRLDEYQKQLLAGGVRFRHGYHYYPWTCDATGAVGWSPTAGLGGIYVPFPATSCFAALRRLDDVPEGIDSLRVVFDLLAECEFDCDPLLRNQSPYLDNIRLGAVGLGVDAPVVTIDLPYQDVFPGNTHPPTQTLACWGTAEVHSYYDNNRYDFDPTNATMGDSVAVITGQAASTHVYLNYRVYPGPCMNRNHPWYVNEYLVASAGDPGGWAEVEMDTVQTFPGNVAVPGRYASYVREGSPFFTPPEVNPAPPFKYNPANKIIEDGVLTPGTRVEYFFSSAFGGGPADPRAVFPDTTGGFTLEFEVLPGYIDVNASPAAQDIRAPCFLYVDADNAGAEVPIQEWGLYPTLGTTNWNPAPFVPPVWAVGFYSASENWDRYDYLGAQTNVCAPMARESAGNNGMSRYQSMIYRWLLYNTGSAMHEGLRDGDARLLENFLINDDFGRNTFRKGLWLSGDGIARILTRPGRPDANTLASGYARITLPDPAPYRELANGGAGDPSFCVKLDAATNRHFPISDRSYASLRGSGCPTELSFQVVSPIGDARGNLVYVDQDGTGASEEFASVSNAQWSTQDGYGVVTDAFSLHYMRSTPDDFTGDGTDACTDSSAIANRVNDVFSWMQVTAAIICDPWQPLDVEPQPGGVLPARTVLLANSPNPFTPTTTVRYQLAEETRVRLEVFDVSGRRVRTLVDGVQQPDRYSVIWDGEGEHGARQASGVYWVRMRTTGGFEASAKLVLLR